MGYEIANLNNASKVSISWPAGHSDVALHLKMLVHRGSQVPSNVRLMSTSSTWMGLPCRAEAEQWEKISIITVLSSLSLSLCVISQFLISATQRSTIPAVAGENEVYSWTSSAQRWSLNPCLQAVSATGAEYIENSTGPITEPQGTPMLRGCEHKIATFWVPTDTPWLQLKDLDTMDPLAWHCNYYNILLLRILLVIKSGSREHSRRLRMKRFWKDAGGGMGTHWGSKCPTPDKPCSGSPRGGGREAKKHLALRPRGRHEEHWPNLGTTGGTRTTEHGEPLVVYAPGRKSRGNRQQKIHTYPHLQGGGVATDLCQRQWGICGLWRPKFSSPPMSLQ